MAEGFRFIYLAFGFSEPFGSVHGLVRCKHERRCHSDVTIKIPDRDDQECEWHHAPEAWAEIWEVSWVLPSEEEGWLSLARWGLASGAHVMGADGKVGIERWYLSPYVEKPFNSKVIKFCTWTKKSSVFRVSGFLCYLCALSYLPTPPLGQDMTQGQFLSGV